MFIKTEGRKESSKMIFLKRIKEIVIEEGGNKERKK
jgi:hypothetical protein